VKDNDLLKKTKPDFQRTSAKHQILS